MLWLFGILNVICGPSLIIAAVRLKGKISKLDSDSSVATGVCNTLVGLVSLYLAWKGWN